MAIKQPNALATSEKKISILLAGYPGIGKTTLALSAPSPLLIDTDNGLDRVSAIHRTPFIQPEDYDELLDDLTPDNLRDFETLVFDTGGQLFKLISSWCIRQDSKNGKRDGSLSLPGYGAAGREFERLIKHSRDTLKKNIVTVFHAKEEKDGDSTRLRILIEGQTKDNIWQPMDLGGFVEVISNKRQIGFTNCERYFAKGTHGVNGLISIPDLKPDAPNDLLTKIFARVNDNIAQEAKEYAVIRDSYDMVIQEASDIIGAIDTPDAANTAVKKIKAFKHALTSEREIRSMFSAKIKELGYKLNKGAYVV